jgi:hypothetical protein
MASSLPSRSTWFARLRFAILLLLVAFATIRLADPALMPKSDFSEYWSSARLFVGGGNPYSPSEMHELQRPFGYEQQATMFCNPPWTLPLLVAFAPFDYGWARLLWLLASLAALFVSVNLLWGLYGGAAERRPLAWLIVVLFVPTLNLLRMGQIVGFLLLGVTLFLLAVRARRDFWAGVALFLPAIKPHLFVPLAIIVFVWALQSRRWRILFGGAAALALAVGVAFAIDPHVFTQYATQMREGPPSECYTPTVSTLLRLACGWEHAWLQYLATFLGAIWAAAYWWNARDRWDWRERLPVVLSVGVLVAPYEWTFDFLLLVFPVLAIAVPLLASPWRWVAFALYVVANAVSLVMLEVGIDPMWQVWFAPTIFGLYVVFRFMVARTRGAIDTAPPAHPDDAGRSSRGAASS